MSVLLSIKPEFVEKIEDGSKLYEFRKSIFKQETNEIWVYASAPRKQIVGKIYVEDIIEDTPQNLWISFQKNAGINQNDFFSYFAGKDKGFAIKIKQFEPFDNPINPYEAKANFVPPQSYAYLSNILPQFV